MYDIDPDTKFIPVQKRSRFEYRRFKKAINFFANRSARSWVALQIIPTFKFFLLARNSEAERAIFGKIFVFRSFILRTVH